MPSTCSWGVMPDVTSPARLPSSQDRVRIYWYSIKKRRLISQKNPRFQEANKQVERKASFKIKHCVKYEMIIYIFHSCLVGSCDSPMKKELMALLLNPSTPWELLYNEAHKFTRAIVVKKKTHYVILKQMLQMPIQMRSRQDVFS